MALASVGRVLSVRLATFCSIGVLAFATIAAAQETLKVIDLRTQPLPENFGMSFTLGLAPHAPPAPEIPLEIIIQSISPVSLTSAKALVEVLVRNTQDQVFYLPVSREWNIIDADGNEDRRMFDWHLWLRAVDSGDEIFISGTIRSSSSLQPDSVVALNPEESALVRFEVDFRSAWQDDPTKWRDNIANGVVAHVEIRQSVLDLIPARPFNRSTYIGRSHRKESENAIPLMTQP